MGFLVERGRLLALGTLAAALSLGGCLGGGSPGGDGPVARAPATSAPAGNGVADAAFAHAGRVIRRV